MAKSKKELLEWYGNIGQEAQPPVQVEVPSLPPGLSGTVTSHEEPCDTPPPIEKPEFDKVAAEARMKIYKSMGMIKELEAALRTLSVLGSQADPMKKEELTKSAQDIVNDISQLLGSL